MLSLSATGRTITMQMLLEASILKPGKSAMTIEYLVNNRFIYNIQFDFLLLNYSSRGKDLSAIYYPMVRSSLMKQKQFSARQVPGPFIVNASSILIKSPVVVGLR